MATTNAPGTTVDSTLAWQLVEKLDEQRSHPRLALNTRVTFRNANGQLCTAQLMNLSRDGIQIRCNVASAQVLHPGGGKICPTNAPLLRADIPLRVASESATLSVCAQLTYLTTVPEEPRCVLGMHFLELRPTAERLLDRFFSAALAEYYAPDDTIPTVVNA